MFEQQSASDLYDNWVARIATAIVLMGGGMSFLAFTAVAISAAT